MCGGMLITSPSKAVACCCRFIRSKNQQIWRAAPLTPTATSRLLEITRAQRSPCPAAPRCTRQALLAHLAARFSFALISGAGTAVACAISPIIWQTQAISWLCRKFFNPRASQQCYTCPCYHLEFTFSRHNGGTDGDALPPDVAPWIPETGGWPLIAQWLKEHMVRFRRLKSHIQGQSLSCFSSRFGATFDPNLHPLSTYATGAHLSPFAIHFSAPSDFSDP